MKCPLESIAVLDTNWEYVQHLQNEVKSQKDNMASQPNKPTTERKAAQISQVAEGFALIIFWP